MDTDADAKSHRFVGFFGMPLKELLQVSHHPRFMQTSVGTGRSFGRGELRQHVGERRQRLCRSETQSAARYRRGYFF